jgi:hypothetical protein
VIRLTYKNEGVTGTLYCPFCEETYTLPGNVHTYRETATSPLLTHPDARLSVYNHFHFDENSYITVCPAMRKVENTTWEAVEVPSGVVVARGRVSVDDNWYVSVDIDEPSR